MQALQIKILIDTVQKSRPNYNCFFGLSFV